ncbi:RagB/SusD family nutrient uptake outer membrane protein, partial [termite gut metagenome]
NENAPLDGVETDMVGVAGDDRALFFAGGDRTVEISTVATFKEGLSVAKWSNNRSDGKTPHDPMYTDTDIPLFRLAEAYLTYAEATLRSGGSEQEALNAVNELRKRAHASELATISTEMILNEKAREMYFEGQRRTDLIRYGYFTSNKYIWDWKGGQANGTSVSSFYNLYPIPVSDIIVNNNLTQNPGY